MSAPGLDRPVPSNDRHRSPLGQHLPFRPVTSRPAALLVAGLVLVACSGDDSTGTETSDPPTSTVTADPAVTSNAPTTTSTTSADASTNKTPRPDAERLSVTVRPSPLIGLAVGLDITVSDRVQIEVTARSGDHVVELPRTAALATEHLIPVVGLRADRTYDIDVEAFGEGAAAGELESVAFHTEPLPAWFPDHELVIDPERSSPGYTLVETAPAERTDDAPDQVLVAYDDAGEVVWYYTNTGAIGGVEQTGAGTFLSHYWPFGIREHDLLGALVGHWRPQPAESGTTDEQSGETADAADEALLDTIDPDALELWLGALAGNPGDMAPRRVTAEWVSLGGFHHENWPMPDGNVLALSTTIHDLTPEQRATFCPGDEHPFGVISDVVVEFAPDGTVLRTWDLWDAIDVDTTPGTDMCLDSGLFAGEVQRDWTHANSVIYDPVRDAIIISSRHTDQIIALDHLDELGPQAEVRWILGEGATVPLDGEQVYHQHAIEVNADGSLIVYDNGNGRPGTSPDDPANPPYSRAVIYDVDDASDDPSDWSATQRWEHRIDDADGLPIYTSFIGDADQLANGNVLITHGGIGANPPDPDDPQHVLIIEVVPDGSSGGEIVWEFRNDPAGPNTSYRSERIESFYVGPDWVPRG